MNHIEFPKSGMSDHEFGILLEAMETVLDLHYDVSGIEKDENSGYVLINEEK